MAIRSQKILPNLNNVGAGQTATLDIPIGNTYHSISFEYSGVTAAQMTNVKVLMNGTPVIEYNSVLMINEIAAFDNRGVTPGIFTIDFERFGMLTRQGREVTAVGTGMGASDANQIRTFQLQFDIASDASAPSIKATATTSAAALSGLIKKVRLFSRSATGAGIFEISNLPKGEIINRIFVISNSGTNKVKKLSLELDNFVKFERSESLNKAIQKDSGVKVPSLKMSVLDPGELGYASETIDTVYPIGSPRAGEQISDLRLKLDMLDADSLLVMVEYIGAVK